jgi:hypothetical protein
MPDGWPWELIGYFAGCAAARRSLFRYQEL